VSPDICNDIDGWPRAMPQDGESTYMCSGVYEKEMYNQCEVCDLSGKYVQPRFNKQDGAIKLFKTILFLPWVRRCAFRTTLPWNNTCFQNSYMNTLCLSCTFLDSLLINHHFRLTCRLSFCLGDDRESSK
jgi:hypothetical protein